MKKLLFLFFFAFIALLGKAQSTNDNEKASDLKWFTNVNEAITVSQKEKKPMLLFFTGSDWCGWCIRLQKEVLKTSEFAQWAKKNVVLVELDFPRKPYQTEEIKKQNAALEQVFQIQGYPTIHFAKAVKNKNGQINFQGLGSTGYVAGGPSAWLAVANGFIANKKA